MDEYRPIDIPLHTIFITIFIPKCQIWQKFTGKFVTHQYTKLVKIRQKWQCVHF